MTDGSGMKPVFQVHVLLSVVTSSQFPVRNVNPTPAGTQSCKATGAFPSVPIACSKVLGAVITGIHPLPWRRAWSPSLGNVFLNTLCLPCQRTLAHSLFACKDLLTISKYSRTQLLCRFTPQFQSRLINQ